MASEMVFLQTFCFFRFFVDYCKVLLSVRETQNFDVSEFPGSINFYCFRGIAEVKIVFGEGQHSAAGVLTVMIGCKTTVTIKIKTIFWEGK